MVIWGRVAGAAATAVAALAVVGCTPGERLAVFDEPQDERSALLFPADANVLGGVEPHTIRFVGADDDVDYFAGIAHRVGETCLLAVVADELETVACSPQLPLGVMLEGRNRVELVQQGTRRDGGRWASEHLWVEVDRPVRGADDGNRTRAISLGS